MAVGFGYSFGIKIEDFGGFVPVLAYCPTAIPPCSGKTPCINTCGCQKDQMLLPSGECQDISDEVLNQLKNNYKLDLNGKWINSSHELSLCFYQN